MKFLNALLVLSMFSFAPLSFATDDPYAPILDAFSSAEIVKEAVADLKASDSTLEEEKVDVIPVAGICGFAGCDNKYLVVLRLANRSHTYYKTVSALVYAPAVGKIDVVELLNFEH